MRAARLIKMVLLLQNRGTMTAAELACGLVPRSPFVVLGQMTTDDPSRSPAGTESAWGYTHVPGTVAGDAAGRITGRWDAADREAITALMSASAPQGGSAPPSPTAAR